MDSPKLEKPNIPHEDGEKGIDLQSQAARHHEEAARFHRLSVKFRALGENHKAYEVTLQAEGHHILAGECQNELFKKQTLTF